MADTDAGPTRTLTSLRQDQHALGTGSSRLKRIQLFVLAGGLSAVLILISAPSTKALLSFRLDISGVPVNALDVTLGVVLAALLVCGARRALEWPDKVVAAYLAASILPLLVGLGNGNRMYEIAQDMRIPVFMALAFLGSRELAWHQKGQTILLTALVGGSLVGAVTEILTFATNIGSVDPAFLDAGFFNQARDASLNANVMACAFFVCAGVLASGKLGSNLRFVVAGALLILAIGVVASLTRTVWAAFGVGCVVFAVTNFRRHRLLKALPYLGTALLVVVVGLQTLAPPLAEAVANSLLRPIRGVDGSVAGRLEEMAEINEKLSGRLIVGAGFGATVKSDLGAQSVETVSVHNGYWWFLLKGGLVYLGCWLAMAGFFFYQSFARPRNGDFLWTRPALLASFSVVGVAALAASANSAPAYAVLNGLLFAATCFVSPKADPI